MRDIFKQLIFLWTILFINFLYADGTDTQITITDASGVYEYDDHLSFTIQLSEAPWFSSVTVNYSTHNSSAVAGNDYTATSGSVTFHLWETSKTIEVPIINDTIHENSETLYMSISNSDSGYIVSDGRGYGTIYDDDAQSFELNQFNDKGVTETDSDQTIYMVAYFNQDTPNALTLTYHTEDNSALSGTDYIGITDTINVPAGVDRVNLPVTIKGDYTPEDTKDFRVIIDSISTGTITDNSATTTIHDDDTIEVDVSCSDTQEGQSGESNNIECRIFLTKEYPAGEEDFTIDYTSQDGSSPSATAGEDYRAVSGTITFTAGDTEHIVNIPTIGDNEIESDENVQLVISGSDYIIDHDSEAEIINDDGSYPGVDFSTADVSVIEGNTSTKTLNFHFELDADAVAGSSFDYYTQDEDAKVSDNDYVEINTTTYNIPENTRAIDIEVTINGDTDIENDETFYLKFTNEKKITIRGDTAKGNILNDDGSFPTLSCTNSVESIIEGESGQKTLTYFFSLDKPIESETSFDYDTWDDDEDDKDADSDDDKDGDGDDDDDNDNDNEDGEGDDQDYEIVPKTHYNIESNETEISIDVTINGDSKIENDEIFYLSLYNFTENLNVDSSCRSIKTTIVNDDGNLSEFSIEAPTLVFDEKDSNQTRVDFTIKLDAPAKQDGLTIEYLTVDGTAQEDDFDFDLIIPTTITFDTGEQNKTFSVYINGDTNIEPDESFFVKLQNPHNATLASRPNNQIEITITNDDVHSDEPFTCDNNMYLSSSIKRGTGETGKMWLHKIDTTHNPFAFNVVDDEGETKLYNALAYSDSGDENITKDYIFGLYKKELLRLSRTGKVISLGNVDELPDILSSKQLFAGAIFDGYYYVSGPGQDYDKIFKIRLSDKTVNEISLDKNISVLDFSFTPNGKYLHSIIDGGELVKIDLTVTPSTVTRIGSAHSGYQFDSTFSDKNGRFFANDSKGNGFFEFDLTTGEKLFLSASQQASFNDGANCLKEALVFNDYGDAPIGYGEPRHTIANGIFMGNEVDHDINPFDTVDADGDDSNGIDDEDGITFVDGTDINGSYFDVNGTQELNITVSKDGYLNAWLDFGIDGSFATAGDQIITAKALTAGTHTINFNIPENVVENKQTYIRFRYSSTANLDFEESAVDGEVEDYAIFFGNGVQAIQGTFNVQRTNSAFNAKDFALYTQIVGRDFDYHVVFYDKEITQEKELIKLPIKIELIDSDLPEGSNIIAPPHYDYFSPLSTHKSRVVVSYPYDLNDIPATKRAIFRVTYPTYNNGDIKQYDCDSSITIEKCYEKATTPVGDEVIYTKFAYSQDKFAIRPESFYISLSDGNQERINSRDTNNKTLRVASGYEYNLTMIATKYGGTEPSLGYNQDYNSSFDFNITGLSSCANTNPIKQSISYRDGIENIPNFKHNNVGHYRLTQISDENWTNIDKADNDCIVNDSTTSTDGNRKSGCNIQLQIHPIDLEFYPDHFNLDLRMSNLPSSGHSDFIYMSELNSTYSRVAIQFDGDITAKSEDNTTTTNFTAGCVATNLLLDLNATTLSVEGTNQNIMTIAGTPVNFTRWIRFNNDTNISKLDIDKALSRVDGVVQVASSRFLDENNGTTHLDMRYNLNKHLSEPINPVQVTFESIEVDSTEANSTAYDKINIISNLHIPKGKREFVDNRKNFYFARVVSDLNSYPAINMNISPIVRTPLNVDIFCKTTINNYCTDRKIMNNTNLTGTTREQIGWYLSAKHNHTVDGNVTNLQATPNIVTIIPNPINPITLTNGENGLVIERFINCSSPQSIIKITTSPALSFEPSQYVLNCSDKNASQWTGIGSTGNILKVKPKVNQTGKMNW